VVQRVVLRYAKRGPLRFASSRDLGRAFERAIRRAGIPIAFSAGFHPHPRISYLGAAPTGAASEAEYLELRLSERRDPAALAAALGAALPAGVAVLAAADGTDGLGAALPRLLRASAWRLEWPGASPADVAGAARALDKAAEATVVRAARPGHSQPRRVEVRPAVLSLRADPDGGRGPAIEAVLDNGPPTVRPDDLAAALAALAPALGAAPPSLTRLAQGVPTPGSEALDQPLG
jgi:radical SAM-linked protein